MQTKDTIEKPNQLGTSHKGKKKTIPNRMQKIKIEKMDMVSNKQILLVILHITSKVKKNQENCPVKSNKQKKMAENNGHAQTTHMQGH